MESILYNQLTLSELSQLAKIRKLKVKTKIKSYFINALIDLDEQTKNDMVCCVCKQSCDRLNLPCGHVSHITCCIKNKDEFYCCSICLNCIDVSKDDMEYLYAEQESKR